MIARRPPKASFIIYHRPGFAHGPKQTSPSTLPSRSLQHNTNEQASTERSREAGKTKINLICSPSNNSPLPCTIQLLRKKKPYPHQILEDSDVLAMQFIPADRWGENRVEEESLITLRMFPRKAPPSDVVILHLLQKTQNLAPSQPQ